MTTKSKKTPSRRASTKSARPTTRRRAVLAKLEAGLAKIESNWTSGAFQDGEAVCALGALGLRSSSMQRQLEATEDAVCFLHAALPKGWKWDTKSRHDQAEAVMSYNDSSDGSQQSVARLFRRAIKLAKAEPAPSARGRSAS